jgi:23S rRNA (uridine2552-2'-O)-methyltransferase
MGDRWVDEHRRDPYTRRAKKENYRSRAAYKLMQINKKFRLIHKNDLVLDLGCAPGGWSQVAAAIVEAKGLVVGVDIDHLDPIPGMAFIRGDMTHEVTQASARACLGGRLADVVLSDMSPNISGNYGLDHYRSMQLSKLTVDFGLPLLSESGHLAVKVFEGGEMTAFANHVKTRFARVKRFRPDATRKASSELYIVALGYDGKGPPEWGDFLAEDDDDEAGSDDW